VPIAIAQSVSTPDIPEGCPGGEGCPTQGTYTAPSNAVYLTTTSLPDATYGAAYSKTLEAIGGQPPYTWSTSSTLPNGLTLNTSTGEISGTPTQTGSFNLTFTVTDNALPAHTATRTLSLLVRSSILIYGPSLWTGGTPSEQTIAQDAGYAVTVKDSTSWSAMTTAQFSSYNAIVIPDPHCTDGPQETPPFKIADTTKGTWSPAVTGSMVILGADPVYHADPSKFPVADPSASAARKAAPAKLILNSINFAASGSSTGLYMALSCAYEVLGGPQTVTPLSSFGSFVVSGPEATTVNVLAPTHPVMAGLDNSSMSDWGSSMHVWFNSYPEGWTALAEETSSASNPNRVFIIAKQP